MSTLVLPAKEKTVLPRWLYVVLCCVFCVLYFVRDILDVNISYYVIYAVAVITLLIVRKSEAVAFFVSISAFTSAGFDGLFCTLLFGCMLFRMRDHIKTVKIYSLLLVLMCVYEFLHYYAVKMTGLGTIVTYIMVMLTLLIVQQCPSEEIDKTLVVNSFIAFSLFFVLMTMIQMIDAFGSLEMLLENGYRTEAYAELREMSGLTANQNYITSLCSLNLCLCVMMIAKKMPKLIYIMAIVIFLISGFLTVSKMFMAVIVVFALYVAFIALKRETLKGLGVVVLLFITGFVIVRLMGDTLIDKIRYRFENEDLTSGRLETIGEMLNYMREHPLTYLLGSGVIQVHYLMPAAIHSSFFEVLGGWGLPGLVMVVGYIGCLVSNARREAAEKDYKPNGYNYLPLLMYLGYSLIGMLFSSAFAVVKIMVCIYALGIKERETNAVQHHNAGV